MWWYLGRGRGHKRGMGLGPSSRRATSGASFLPSTIEINSITETAVWRYEARDISGSTWTAAIGGSDLTLSGSGSAPVVSVVPEFDDGSREVTFQAGKYFTVADNAIHDLATEDMVLEFVTRFDGTNSYIAAKGIDPGWRVREGTTFTYANLGGSSNISAGMTNSVLYHNIMFYDRSGSVGYYRDGTGVAVVSISAQSGDQSNASNFSLGADSAGSFPTGASIVMIQAWKRSAWLDTHIQTTVAGQRYSLLTGT